eukprot:g2782.t1
MAGLPDSREELEKVIADFDKLMESASHDAVRTALEGQRAEAKAKLEGLDSEASAAPADEASASPSSSSSCCSSSGCSKAKKPAAASKPRATIDLLNEQYGNAAGEEKKGDSVLDAAAGGGDGDDDDDEAAAAPVRVAVPDRLPVWWPAGSGEPPAGTNFKDVKSFSYDQSDKFVSVYVSLDEGEGDLLKSEVTCKFSGRRFDLYVQSAAKGNHWLAIPNLCKLVNNDKSKVTVKPARLVVKLRKTADGQEWSALDDSVDLKNAAREKRMRGNLKEASTQELLADMYKHASDEEREGLSKAWCEGRDKREGNARKKRIEAGWDE